MDKVDSKLHRRQVALMKKRFDVDEVNKVVKLDLSYDDVNEVLQSNIDTYVPTFDREKFGKIKEVISEFPQEYKADLNIKIKDYGEVKPTELMDGFNDAVELTHYSGNREHKKKWIQITFLLIAGILLLNIMAKGLIENWLGLSETGTSVFKEVFDITSWVFIWEAVSLLFLSPSEDRTISLTLAHRLRHVAFLDKDNKVLVQEDYRDSYADTAKERKLRSVGKYALLITGAAFFALGVSNLITFFSTLPTYFVVDAEDGAIAIIFNVVMALISLSIIIFEALGGFAAISAFTGKGRMYRTVLPFGIIAVIVEGLALAVYAYLGASLVLPIVGFAVAILYVLGAIFLIITKDKESEKVSK